LLETDGLFGLETKQLYGTLTGGRLSLNFPTDTGRIEKLILNAVSEEQWNRTLAAFTRGRAAEVAALRRQQTRAAAIQELQGRLQAAQSDEAQAEQDLADLEKRKPGDERERDQAQQKLETARHRLDRAHELRRVAGEREKAANAVARKAVEVGRQCNSAASLEAVKHAQQVVGAVAAGVREVAAEIHREASLARRGDPSENADLHVAQQTLDAATKQVEGELPPLSAAHSRLDDDTQGQIESAAGDVESAASDVESAASDVESAASDVESTISDVESQATDAQTFLTDADGRMAQDRQASADRRARISADRRLIQDCERQLHALDPARGLDLLTQYAAAIHWFNPRLSGADSWRLAKSIVWYSQRHGLDARLLLAVMAAEGSLDQIQTGRTQIGRHPFEVAINTLATDLHKCLERTAGPGAHEPTWQQIEATLTLRYKSRKGATSEGARRYVQKVARFYYQMCGLKPPDD
jgi:hypothetical protein